MSRYFHSIPTTYYINYVFIYVHIHVNLGVLYKVCSTYMKHILYTYNMLRSFTSISSPKNNFPHFQQQQQHRRRQRINFMLLNCV